jgi:hypothetical protein
VSALWITLVHLEIPVLPDFGDIWTRVMLVGRSSLIAVPLALLVRMRPWGRYFFETELDYWMGFVFMASLIALVVVGALTLDIKPPGFFLAHYS